MKRFILLSFGFLGWAFYEMSGGDEFESASALEARLNPAPVVVVTEVAQENSPAEIAEPEAEPVVTAEAEVIDTDPPAPTENVTRVALNLTTLDDAQEAQPANIDPVTGVAVNTDTSVSSADTLAIIPSLIAPNDTGAATTDAAIASAADVRKVSGNRVNVRGGPGTDFGIVARLVRGDAVEIIQDNGNGWVLTRPVDGGTEGWMADFLLTSG